MIVFTLISYTSYESKRRPDRMEACYETSDGIWFKSTIGKDEPPRSIDEMVRKYPRTNSWKVTPGQSFSLVAGQFSTRYAFLKLLSPLLPLPKVIITKIVDEYLNPIEQIDVHCNIDGN